MRQAANSYINVYKTNLISTIVDANACCCAAAGL